MARLRCLVADIPAAHPRIARALAGYDLEFVTNSRNAKAAMTDRPFDLVVVGMDLDESRATDVVAELGAIEPRVPVICIRAAAPKYRLTGTTLEGFRIACVQIGARGLVDFFDFRDDAEGDAAIRSAINQLLGPRV